MSSYSINIDIECFEECISQRNTIQSSFDEKLSCKKCAPIWYVIFDCFSIGTRWLWAIGPETKAGFSGVDNLEYKWSESLNYPGKLLGLSNKARRLAWEEKNKINMREASPSTRRTAHISGGSKKSTHASGFSELTFSTGVDLWILLCLFAFWILVKAILRSASWSSSSDRTLVCWVISITTIMTRKRCLMHACHKLWITCETSNAGLGWKDQIWARNFWFCCWRL